MTNTQHAAIVAGLFLMVGAATFGTYWVASRGTEAKPAVVATAAAEAPAAPPAVGPAPANLEVIHADVYFDFKTARLSADAVRLLQEKAALMDHASVWVALVQGHSDRQGPAEYNKVLAQRRADAVKRFLVELGVPEASIKVVAIGPDGALCDEPTKECQQLNRRVHLEIRKLARTAVTPVRIETKDGAQPAPKTP